MGEESVTHMTEQEQKISRQINYYFGDANLNRDKFLKEETKKDEGWVKFETLLTFKRLAALTTDVDVIIAALQKSESDLIEISEDKLKIRRNPERVLPEFTEEVRKEMVLRTAYCKGFPLNTEIGDLLEYFNSYNNVENVQMRKYLDKPSKTMKFKGSVFVTFKTVDDLKAFLEPEKIQYKESDLIHKSQEQYLNEKKEESDAKKAKKEANKQPENTINLPKAAVLYFEGCPEDLTREDLRPALEEKEADVAFIDFNKGDKCGHLRLTEDNSAQAFFDKLEDSKLKIKDADITFRVLTEEEDVEYLKKAVEQIKNRRNNHGRNNRKHNNRFGNRKRGGDRNGGDEPRAKEARV